MREKWYDYWYLCFQGISNQKKLQLYENGFLPEQLYNIEETILKMGCKDLLSKQEMDLIYQSRRIKNWQKEYDIAMQQGIQIVSRHDEHFPKRLNQLKGMPYALCYKGVLPEEETCSIAIVGARNCSTYGESMTLQFAECLAGAGIQIISGMARGVDGAAHRGALNVGGNTFAILGCGVDICYPREHRGLYQDLQRNGGVISEYPPGTPPVAKNFPARNRLISGMADIVLVMEAREKSGSLITADMALEQGRDVYALPGPINSDLSKGCHYLIRQGAEILMSPEDLLHELSIQKKIIDCKTKKIDQIAKLVLESKENLVYSCLDLYPVSQQQLIELTGLEPKELLGILVGLELKGYIKEKSKNYYIKQR